MAHDNHDHPNNEAPGASPDPVALTGRRRREPHPLFPRDDGLPEDRDIQFVTFRRRRTGDRLMQNYPEEVPAHEVRSWAQVVAWWGGGEYKALGKNAKHELVAIHPAGTDEWECFDGDSKLFTFRNGSPYAGYAEHPAPSPRTVEAAPAPAPAAQSRLEAQVAELGTHVVELARELRASHAAPPVAAPPPAASNENVLIAMINTQAQTMQAAAAREAENMRVMMTAVLNQRAVDAKPAADPTAGAIAIVKELRGLIQPASPQSPVGDTIEHFKALKEISTPPATSGSGQPQSELSELISGFTTMMQVEASKSAVASVTEPPRPASPERRSRPRELYRWPGYGLMELVEPEPPMPPPAAPPPPPPAARGLDMEAIKRDPALRARALAELGVDVSVVADAPPPALSMPTAPAPMPESPPPSMPTAPAPMPEPPPPSMSSTPAPTVDVAESEPPPAAPASEVNIEALLADPAQRARVLQVLAAAMASEPSQVAEPAPSAPSAVAPQAIISTASPTTAAPAPMLDPAAPSMSSAPAPAPVAPPPIAPEPIAPAPIAPPTKPIVAAAIAPPTKPIVSAPIAPPPPTIAPAASNCNRAPNAEPQRTAARVLTSDDRTRAIPSLRVIARLSPEQRRAEIRKLPGMEEGAVDGLTEALGLMVNLPPEAWTQVAALLPTEAVWALVGGVGG